MQIINQVIGSIDQRNNEILGELRQIRNRISIQIVVSPLARPLVDEISNMINSAEFRKKRREYTNSDSLDVVVDSFGGDADTTYHLAKLLHRAFPGKITYIVPRTAKSAATLLVCGGDAIVMGETSELGPLDPQIPQDDGSYISAKAVEVTTDLIKKHLKEGGDEGLKLATILANRINPLTLGQYQSTMDIAQKYQKELLLLRMFKSQAKVEKIVKKFAEGYTHHSRVIDCNEAVEIFGESNVEVWDADKREWALVREFYGNQRTIADLYGVLRVIDRQNNR